MMFYGKRPPLNGVDRSFSGKEPVARNYRELFAAMRNVRFEFLQRFATEDRVSGTAS
jgi:hypothetical protein